MEGEPVHHDVHLFMGTGLQGFHRVGQIYYSVPDQQAHETLLEQPRKRHGQLGLEISGMRSRAGAAWACGCGGWTRTGAGILFQGQGHAEQDARGLRKGKDKVGDLLRRVLLDAPAADMAVRYPDAGVQESQVVVDLGHSSDGRPRVPCIVLLAYGKGGADALDVIHIRTVDALQKLPRISG